MPQIVDRRRLKVRFTRVIISSEWTNGKEPCKSSSFSSHWLIDHDGDVLRPEPLSIPESHHHSRAFPVLNVEMVEISFLGHRESAQRILASRKAQQCMLQVRRDLRRFSVFIFDIILRVVVARYRRSRIFKAHYTNFVLYNEIVRLEHYLGAVNWYV